MAKNPFIAAALNFLIWGTGYIYLGKKNPGYYLIPFWIVGLIIFATIYGPGEQVLIHGNVLDHNVKTPLANVSIAIYNYEGNFSSINSSPIYQTNTNSQGLYQLRDITPGKYILVFSKEGYNSELNYINIVGNGDVYELNVILMPKGYAYIMPTYLIPEIIILDKLGVHMPKNVEIFTWIFAIIISLAFAMDAFKEAKRQSVEKK